MSVMYRLVLQKSVRVTGVGLGNHITHMKSDRVWICELNNLILPNVEGDILDRVTDLSDYGVDVHTVTQESDIIYIDSNYNIIKLSTDKVKTTVIPYNTSPWRPRSVYSSTSTGDLLVGMYNDDTETGQVNCYTDTGKLIQTIQHHNNTGQGLYRIPNYITETAIEMLLVVVTDSTGRQSFSYKGPPSDL